MHAIIQVGSHQYDVEPGKIITVEKLDGRVGSEVRFNRILLLSDGNETKAGPALKAAVFGTISAQERGAKIRVFKKIRRKGYHKTMGHRQPYTKIKITRIEV
ncbi:MAG: 50S ribosomal protein L21 [Pseudomonadota bacterium]